MAMGIIKQNSLFDKEILSGLETDFIGRNIIYFNEIDSTNLYAKQIAASGCREGTLVIADNQTKARGRLGREWLSSKSQGIYMSVILKPDISPEKILILTITASVAVVRAIEKVLKVKLGIKWPNDIIVNNKKVCGILTEMNTQSDKINFVVMGIGINVVNDENDFPEEIKKTATSLKNYVKIQEVDLYRIKIIQAILKELELLYTYINSQNTIYIINEWKKYSITLGQKIFVISGDSKIKGVAKDILEDGKLVVEIDNNKEIKIFSGEVSIRRY